MEDVKRYAVIKDGAVINIVLWDGVISDPEEPQNGLVVGWQPPEDCSAVECPDGAGIDWTYENGEWLAPPAPPAPEEE